MTTQEKDGPPIGVYDFIPNGCYHRGVGISKSGLDLIDRSPLHYKTVKEHPRPQTPVFFLGSAVHCLVLEPDLFPKEYIKAPDHAPPRPTERQIMAKKPSAATFAAIDYWRNFHDEAAGREVITNKPGNDPFWSPGDWDKIHYMRDSVLSHPLASILLDQSQGKPEVSAYWLDHETKKLCKCRADFLNESNNVAVDLKTTEDASYTGFGKSCANFRYHVQGAWYRDGLREAGRPVSDFVFVAVEKAPPYAVACYVITPEGRRIGGLQYRKNLATYAACHKAEDWPGYPDEIRDLELPRWGLVGKIS